MSISEPQPTSGRVKKKKKGAQSCNRALMLCWFSQGYSEIYHLRNFFFFFQKPICDEFVQEFQGFFFSSIGKCPSLLHTPTARFSRLEAVQEQMINPGNIKGAKENKEFTEFTISPSGHAQYVIGQ